MRGDFGYVVVKGERLPLTLRGYVAYLIVGGVVIVAGLWLVLTVVIVGLSPLYG
jgi:hypothetical protein